MKPDKEDSYEDQTDNSARPWLAIAIGAFVCTCGVLTAAYGLFAITWTGETTPQIVQVESSPANLEQETDEELASSQNEDGPLRTSTTRRRTLPTTTVQEPDTLVSSSSDDEETNDTTDVSDLPETNDDAEQGDPSPSNQEPTRQTTTTAVADSEPEVTEVDNSPKLGS